MHLTAFNIPTLSNQLHALSGRLDKTEAFRAERGESADGLLALRRAPDMFPLTTQLRFIAFQVQEPVYRLRGKTVPEECFRFGRRAVTAGRGRAPGSKRAPAWLTPRASLPRSALTSSTP